MVCALGCEGIVAKRIDSPIVSRMPPRILHRSIRHRFIDQQLQGLLDALALPGLLPGVYPRGQFGQGLLEKCTERINAAIETDRDVSALVFAGPKAGPVPGPGLSRPVDGNLRPQCVQTFRGQLQLDGTAFAAPLDPPAVDEPDQQLITDNEFKSCERLPFIGTKSLQNCSMIGF
jgi:hypothetical protein